MTPTEQKQTLWEYSQGTYFGFWEYSQIDIGSELNIFQHKTWQTPYDSQSAYNYLWEHSQSAYICLWEYSQSAYIGLWEYSLKKKKKNFDTRWMDGQMDGQGGFYGCFYRRPNKSLTSHQTKVGSHETHLQG